MSNVKRVEIEAVVPFDYLNRLSMEDAARLAVLTLTPSSGLRYEVDGLAEYVANEFGGHTAMYRVRIVGEEAVAFGMIDEVVRSLEAVGGQVRSGVQDLEA